MTVRGIPVQHGLLVFVPIALGLEHAGTFRDPVVFFAAALAIVPIAHFISASTEELSTYTGESIGALLNATFGNLPELIICVVALKAGLHDVVSASLVGAILFNLLLVLGLCLLLAGLRRHTLELNARAIGIYSSMMFVSVMSLALPSIYRNQFAPTGAAGPEESINLGLAVVLLILFGLYLLFMVKTHPDVFASVEPAPAHAAKHSFMRSFVTLIVASVGAAIMSEVLVGAVEGTGEALGLSAPFVGIVLLASVGGSAEAASALSMARKGRIDLALGIAFGSCILIALFISPVLVLASYALGPAPFDLRFSGAGIGLLFLSILIAAVVTAGGSGHWYKGVQLITVYVMIALLLYFVPL